MKVEQFEFGVQKIQFGDHVYKWYVTPETDEEKETILDYCKENLMRAPRSKEEYFRDKRDKGKTFHEYMEIICCGYYTLRELNGIYLY